MPAEPCKPVPFYRSHRFWALMTAVAGGITTYGVPAVVALNPVAGLVVKLIGVGLMIAGTAGQAVYGITSNRAVEWKLPDALKRNGNGNPPMPPPQPQP